MKTTDKQLPKSEKISFSKSSTLTERFTKICNSLEDYRFLLLVMMILIQGCVFVPATILVISFINIGLADISVILLVACTFGVLITNMAETSIKMILITFVFSCVSCITIIAIHLIAG